MYIHMYNSDGGGQEEEGRGGRQGRQGGRDVCITYVYIYIYIYIYMYTYIYICM